MPSYALPQKQARASEAELHGLVIAFYSAVRGDPLLGSIFSANVSDWVKHALDTADFWSSVILGSGRYKSNPFASRVSKRRAVLQEARWPARF